MSQVDTTWFHLRAQQASECTVGHLPRAGDFHERPRAAYIIRKTTPQES